MCGAQGLDVVLCDECFAKTRGLREDFYLGDYCLECDEKLERFCWCCMTLSDEPIDGACKSCQKAEP